MQWKLRVCKSLFVLDIFIGARKQFLKGHTKLVVAAAAAVAAGLPIMEESRKSDRPCTHV